jgi:ribose transport system substrate-binding protein
MKVKKIIALLLGVLMLFTIAVGCDSTKDPKETDPKPVDAEIGEIAYVAYYTTIPYWNDGIRGLEAAAKELGIDFSKEKNFYGPTDGSGSNQATIIEELVAKGVSGIIVSPVDGDAISGACREAMKAGIPVVSVISGINDPDAYYGSLGASNLQVGVTGGNFIAEKIGKAGKVGILTIPGVPVHDERTQGYLNTFAQYPDIEVLDPVNTDADAATGQARAAALIQANPDLKAIVGTDSVGGAAAARAVEEAGKKGEIIVVAMDRDQDLLGYIKDGLVTASVASRSFTTKYMAMYYIYWILKGSIEDIKPGVPNRSVGLDPIPFVTDTGNMLITAENVDLFLND